MLTLILSSIAGPTWADSSRKPAPRAPFFEVRLTLSEPASQLLPPGRFRRYLAIELDDTGHVSPQSDGPLGDHVAYVWIDVPEPGRVLIQTRVGGRIVTTRNFPLREGLRADVAARSVAIATSEMVRAQTRPLRVRKPKRPPPPTQAEIERATRDNFALLFAGKGTGAWIPSTRTILGGSTLELSFRSAKVRQFIAGSWLVGSSDLGSMRWVEVGAGADRSIWLSSRWRSDVGIGAFAAAVHTPETSHRMEGDSSDSWSARGTGRLKLERTVGGGAWLGMSLEPGVLLRPVSIETAEGPKRAAEGFFLGMSLSLQFEQRYQSLALTPVSR